MKETEKENIGKLSTQKRKTNILRNINKHKRHMQDEKNTQSQREGMKKYISCK